jgi:hypothetical protein
MKLMCNLIVASIITCLALPAFAVDAVPNAATAIKISERALKAKLGEKVYSKLMQNAEWKADVRGDEWIAGPARKPQQKPTTCNVKPGYDCVIVPVGGWTVRLSRQDGHVISVTPVE